jgi:hypothetical protein
MDAGFLDSFSPVRYKPIRRVRCDVPGHMTHRCSRVAAIQSCTRSASGSTTCSQLSRTSTIGRRRVPSSVFAIARLCTRSRSGLSALMGASDTRRTSTSCPCCGPRNRRQRGLPRPRHPAGQGHDPSGRQRRPHANRLAEGEIRPWTGKSGRRTTGASRPGRSGLDSGVRDGAQHDLGWRAGQGDAGDRRAGAGVQGTEGGARIVVELRLRDVDRLAIRGQGQ